MDPEEDFMNKMKKEQLKNLAKVVMQFAITGRDTAEHMVEAKELLPKEDIWYLQEMIKLSNKFLLEKTGTTEHDSGLKGLAKNRHNDKPDWNDL